MTAKLNVVAMPTGRFSHAPSHMLSPGSRTAQADSRWTATVAALASLRDQRRRAIRIVDADCACGTLLIAVAQHARALGSTAI